MIYCNISKKRGIWGVDTRLGVRKNISPLIRQYKDVVAKALSLTPPA